MKFMIALVGLSVAVMVAMIVQTLRQEFNLHVLKTRMVENTVEVGKKEKAIVEIKGKVNELKTKVTSINTKLSELRRTRADNEKSTTDLDKVLQTCIKDKEAAEKKRAGITDSIAKLKANHQAIKTVAMQNIQTLKQQILDRDKAICAFADTTKEEARKLCGIPETLK